MRNIFKIHPMTYIMLLIALLTGHFKEITIFMIIILVHELGHILAGLLLKWQIKKVVILPFGGITIFKAILNKPLIEEFIIAIMGLLFQLLFTLICPTVLIKNYSLIILLINLIPIYPLDGSKILSVFFNKVFPFKFSHKLTNYLSLFLAMFLLFFFFLKHELIYILFITLIIIKLKDEFTNHNLIYEKFLYERYIYNLKFKKIKIIKNINQFYKDHYHFIKNNTLIEEVDILRVKYTSNGAK